MKEAKERLSAAIARALEDAYRLGQKAEFPPGDLSSSAAPSEIRDAIEAMRREAYQECKDAMVEELSRTITERNEARAQLQLAKTPRDYVWMWMPSEDNAPASLACPVVMAPETLRAFVAAEAERDRLRLFLDKAANHLESACDLIQEDHSDSDEELAEERAFVAELRAELNPSPAANDVRRVLPVEKEPT